MRYWRRVAGRARADTARLAEPHKWPYATAVTVVSGAIGYAVFGLPDAGGWWSIAAAALLGNVLAIVVVHAAQFVATPARLDRECATEIERLRGKRTEAHALMVRLVCRIDDLTALRGVAFESSWPELLAALDDLRPRIKDDEYLALAPPHGVALYSERHRALDGLRVRLLALMREYR